MLACPLLDLVGVSIGAAVAVGPASIRLLKEALVLPLQLVVEDDTLDPCLTVAEPLGGVGIRPIDLGVVLELARLSDARVERLAGLAADVAAVRFKELPAALSEGDSRLSMPFERDGFHEPRLAQMAQIALTRIGWTLAMIAKFTSRDHPKRTDRGERAALGATKAVFALAHMNTLALVAPRQVDALGEHVTRINGIALARVAAGATAPTDVRSIAVAFPRVVTPSRIVAVEHDQTFSVIWFVIWFVDRVRWRHYPQLMHRRLPPEPDRGLARLRAASAASSVEHDAWFRREVEKGQQSAREGRVLDNGEVASRIDQRYRA